MGYADFAGSGVVHLLGGTCAFVACMIIKPRLGRFDSNGKPEDMPGHSVPLAGLGGFILLFGFLAFNGGSQVILIAWYLKKNKCESVLLSHRLPSAMKETLRQLQELL